MTKEAVERVMGHMEIERDRYQEMFRNFEQKAIWVDLYLHEDIYAMVWDRSLDERDRVKIIRALMESRTVDRAFGYLDSYLMTRYGK